MAKITRTLSSRTNKLGTAEIKLRISVSHSMSYRIKSGIYVSSSRFKDGKFIIPRDAEEKKYVREIEAKLEAIEHFLIETVEYTPAEKLSKEYILEQLDNFLNPVIEQTPVEEVEVVKDFFDVYEDFIVNRNISTWRIKRLRVLKRALMRYEQYIQIKNAVDFKITLDGFSSEDVKDFEWFLRNEHLIYKKYPKIYDTIIEESSKSRKKPKPLPKGNNTIINLFGVLRAFFRWCRDENLTLNDPFAKYNGVTVERYGTPYYLTLEERDTIADFDLSKNPSLEVQRDIFIFQCLIGCRVSDLMALTPNNIIRNAIEYMPQKTSGEHPQVVRVPLNSRALALVKKYKRREGLNGQLFPFISSQKYNVAIKKIFKICGVNRMVTILNPTTGREEKRPLDEIASSHLARRTFIGNLYKKVKDPNLVGSLSGHKEGSKAFARYRDIDEDMKKELVSLLD
ncbi:MAG: recombinase [Bacteroidales bacterium]|nr:recombinase [Bacteroidales bacterium]